MNFLKDMWVEISSQVVNGLFTITGVRPPPPPCPICIFPLHVSSKTDVSLRTGKQVGLAPQRCLDSYRIWRIWRLQKLTLKRLKERGLPCPGASFWSFFVIFFLRSAWIGMLQPLKSLR